MLDNLQVVKQTVYYFADDSDHLSQVFYSGNNSTAEDEEDDVEIGKVPWSYQDKNLVGSDSNGLVDLLGGYGSDSESGNDQHDATGCIVRIPVEAVVCRIGDQDHYCSLRRVLA